MGSLVQLGDVPAWISTATGAASLYVGLRNRQQVQALDWAQALEELAGLTPEELRRTVEDNPVIAQMVDLAWAEAARTASEAKRRRWNSTRPTSPRPCGRRGSRPRPRPRPRGG